MGIHLITGHAGFPHVTSDDQRHQNAVLHGSGSFIVNGCSCTMNGPNTAHISEGMIIANGAFVRVTSGGVDVPVTSGELGISRTDYIVLRYSVQSAGTEKVEIVCKRGSRGVGGNILDGSTSAEFELYSLAINGVNVGTPVQVIPTFTSIMALGLGNLATKDSLSVSDIPSLPATKITSGTLDGSRVPNLDAGKITSGTLNAARIPSLAMSKVSGLTDAAKASDWIAGAGTSDAWSYIKFNDGTAVCEMVHSPGFRAIDVAWNNVFYNGAKVALPNYPFDFVSTPAVSLYSIDKDNIIISASDAGATKSNPGNYWIVNFSKTSNECHVGVIAIGRWK